MANSTEYDVIINVITGHLEKATKQLRGMAGATDDVATSQNKAAKAGKAHNDILNGGVASANNSARGMSKLLDTVGGNNSGLVAAYATLATNAFAVSAAFTTLKSAYQAQQLLQGLEAQGARTGKTLTTVAESVRKLTGESISAADAMRYTAQASSAGISGKDLERLTKVATSSARALGRDAPDSINRLIMAVTKMEPELVDELGLTIKITEAMDMYARQTGKTASSLSQLEKQQALLNAWASQGEAKFGALAESVDPNPYDQLAASFTNLTNNMLNFANNIGVVSFVKILGQDELALTAALIYLVNTVKGQVLPVFADASKAAKKLSDERLEGLTKEQSTLAKVTKTLNNKVDESKKLVGGLTTLTGKGVSVPPGYKEWLTAMRQGIDTTEQFKEAQNSLTRSIKLNETFSKKAAAGTLKRGTKSPEEYTAIAEAHKAELADMEKYAAGKKILDAEIAASGKQKIAIEREIAVITAESAAQGARSDAITALSKGKLKASIASLVIATKQYSNALREEIILKAEEAGVTNAAAVANTNLNRALVLGKAGWFGAVTGIKAVGAAILEWLPYLGLAVLAWDALLWVIDKLEPDSWKKQAEAYNKLSEVVSSTKDKIEALQKIEASSASVADKGSAALTNRVNTLAETVRAYDEYTKSVEEANKSSDSSSNSLFKLGLNFMGLLNPITGATVAWNMWKESTRESLGLDDLVNSIYDIGPASSSANKAAASMLASLNKQLPKTTEEFVKANGGLKNLSDEAKNEAVVAYFKKIQPVAESAQKGVQELSVAVTSLNNAYGDFVNSLKVTTPYDKLGDSLTGVLTTVSKLRTDLKSGVLSSEDANKFVTDLNASMGNINTGMLASKTKEAYDNVTAIDKTIQDLQVNQTRLNATTQEYKNIASQLVALDKQKALALANFSDVAEKDLKVLDQRVFKSRLDSISLQASLSLAQARLSVIQRQGILSKQDSDREIEAKNHIIKLQADIQSAQVEYLRGLELQKKQDLDRAVRQAEELKRLQSMTDEQKTAMLYAAQFDLSQEEGRGRLGQGGTPDVARIQADRELIKKLEAARDPGASQKAQEDIERARKELTLFTAQVDAQQKMVDAIRLGAITASEKTAQGAKADLAVLKERASLEGARNDAIQKRAQNERLIANIASKGLTTAKNEFETIRDTYKDKVIKAKQAYDFKVKELEIDQTLAQAQGRTDDVKIYQKRLDLVKEEYTANIQNLNLEQRLEIYRKIDLDTQEKKLSLLKQALEVQTALADQQKTILDKEQELYRLRAENAVNRRGGVLSETAQKGIEAKAAKEQLDLAERQLALRKIGISLEYDILEAKRVLLREELKAKKAEADRLAATSTGPEKSAAQELSRTLSSAIEGVGAQSYEVLKQNALRIADMDVQILRERAIKAYNELVGKFVTPTLFDRMKGAQNNAKILQEALIARKTQQTTPDQTIPKAIVDRQKDLTAAITENFPELTAQIAALVSSNQTATKAAIDNAKTPQKITTTAAGLLKLPQGVIVPGGEYGAGRTYNGKPGKHKGVDIARKEGLSVTTPISGKIIKANETKLGGFFVTVENESKNLRYTVRHLKENVHSMVGTLVEAGDIIGKVGKTGRASGAHEHIEVSRLRDGEWEKINPEKFVILQKRVESVADAFKNWTPPIAPTAEMTTKEAPSATTARLTAADTPSSITAGALESLSTVKTAELPSTDISKTAESVKAGGESIKLSFAENMLIAREQIQPLLEDIGKLGPEGELIVSVVNGTTTMISAFDDFFSSIQSGGVSIENATALASSALSVLSGLNDASAKSKAAAIDKEIAAEQKRDGKSKESLAKIAALQKKKEADERKAFENNKKLKMAEVVINTAAAIAEALPNIPKAIIAGAMGAAQLAVIASTSYSGYTSPPAEVSAQSATLSVGKRNDSVDLARGSNANAGGEVGYLRGSEGTGSNASNYRTVGSAYGGELMRGYGNRGFVVGEKGPEVITPETPISVTPANDVGMAQPINANFTIQALDSNGVQDILVSQKGNIIKMLREAANASGKTFMEDVNVNVYTRPSVGKL